MKLQIGLAGVYPEHVYGIEPLRLFTYTERDTKHGHQGGLI